MVPWIAQFPTTTPPEALRRSSIKKGKGGYTRNAWVPSDCSQILNSGVFKSEA
jgi:hypothetical protein